MRLLAGWFRLIVVSGIFLIFGYAAVQLAGHLTPSRGQRLASTTPPPAGEDPLNRAVFIEGGMFMRGSIHAATDTVRAGPRSRMDEDRVLPTTIPGFWIQEHEVTNAEYLRFDGGHRFPEGYERHPVVNITWGEAFNYAISIGGLLPTEWQWEFAARGTESRKYPWGDAEPTCERAHYSDCAPRGTVEVMGRPAGATPEGLYDMAGNVWEWVMPGWFEPGRTPVNPDTPRLRGGSFAEDGFFLRAANRNNQFFPWFKGQNIGFRVVWLSKRGHD